MYIGSNVSYLRKERGLKQTDLAKMISKTSATIGGYEKGLSLPPIDIILKFCEIFEVSIDDFVNKDLSRGEGISTPTQAAQPQYDSQDYKLLVKMLVLKIQEVASRIKDKSPDVYEEVGLEEIMRVIEEY